MNIQQPDRSLQLVDAIDETEVSGRIAVATSDRLYVNEHFGTATNFLIFALIKNEWHLQKAIEYPATDRKHSQNKLISRINALAGCNAVYSNAVGPSAVQQLLQKKIQPIIVESDTNIKQLLAAINQDRKTARTGWLSQLNKTKSQLSDKREKMLELLDEDWE
ncbi:NifB/NifX family molybdenum-iron cluster-binding protein [Reinekea marinisedimentorum]|uniref:Nitrogen fixation protein NifX n=1 Tax=Reinekea marinisedimentorum TaxID=230495 RepID=A0A4V2UJE2_9GAMM|nr:NifB/NifX family molybdenum-iron cluster-binding protein [Reinekea marinisedimentorum]TCS39720.1 nitrogen fixation protein NifX [Reinekea marinisedimentorum]